MGKASFNKQNRREKRDRTSGCSHCAMLAAGDRAFDAALARRGVRLEAEPGSLTVSMECPACGSPRETIYHSLSDEMKREITNIMRAVNRDIRLRRSCADELHRMHDDFRERYLSNCIALYGLVFAEADDAADRRIEEWLAEHGTEGVAKLERVPTPPVRTGEG